MFEQMSVGLWIIQKSKISDKNGTADDSDEYCAGFGCCILPLILAFMLGALFRQGFRWVRAHYITVIPPYTVIVIIVGGCFALAVEKWKPLKAYNRCLAVNGKTLMHISLPLLVFHPTFKTEMQTFKKSLNQVLFIGVTGYAIMLLLTASGVMLIFKSEWSFYTCIIFGIVVCATDPLAVDDAVRVSGVSVDLAALMQGESIIGGATSMICFKLTRLLLILALYGSDAAYKQEVTIFVVQCVFAPLYGVLTAMMTVVWVSRIYNDATLEITIVLSLFHLVYYTSELLRLPGMLAVLFFGLYLSSSRASISHTVEATMKKSFRVLTDIHNSVMYFYAGAMMVNEGLSQITYSILLYNLLIWVIVNLSRAIMVFFVSPVLRRLGLGMSWEHALTVWIAGLNGSFNIILAFMASQDLKTIRIKSGYNKITGSNMFFQTCMTLIFLKQILNTSITRFVLRAFGLRAIPKFHQMSLSTAMRRLKLTRSQTINSLKSDRFMADAAFDIVETETETDDIFKYFGQKKVIVSDFLKKMHRSGSTTIRPSNSSDIGMFMGESRENKTESIQMLLKAQKKTYWEHFDRGLMSKEALHQLTEWADSAADHKGRYLDVKKVKEACQVKPFLKSLKRQVKAKLRHLQLQRQGDRGFLYWQQQVLQLVLSYGFHIIDTLNIVLAVALEATNFDNKKLYKDFNDGVLIWNCVVVGMYGLIAIGEMLVMRLRFFKSVWHDITLVIVVIGTVDVLVLTSLGDQHGLRNHPNYAGRLFIRLIFIFSRSARLLAMVENVPWMLRKLAKLLEKRISGHLGVGYDICCAYVTGQGQVVRQLDTLVNENDIRKELKRTCDKHKMDIIRTLGILALENPIIALSVKTRQAMRIVLNAQHDTVTQLKEEGAITDTDASLLTKDLEERMKRLLNSPPLVEDDSRDSILKNIGWVQDDEEFFDYLKKNLEILQMRANTIVTEQDGEDFNIYIIGSGVARLERMQGAFSTNVLDYLTTGNVIGEINFLTKAVRHKTLRCETAVTVLVLNEDVMEKALQMTWNTELPPILYRMWLVIAKRVAIRVIMDDPDYQGISMERLRMQMYNGYLMDDRLGTSISIHADPSDTVILVHGYARDAFTRQPFQGPCFIPRTCFQLHLMPEEGLYTLVLVIPNEPIELEDYCINPARTGSQVDASILAVSSSGTTNAMQLEDIYKNATAATITDGASDMMNRKMTHHAAVPEFRSDSDSSSSSTENLTTSNISEGMIPLLAQTADREITVAAPISSSKGELVNSEIDRSQDVKKRSHMPDGATWQMSDTWDQPIMDEGQTARSPKVSDASKPTKSSSSTSSDIMF